MCIDIPFDMTCWYINARRLIELVGVDCMSPRRLLVGTSSGSSQNSAELARQKEAIVSWLTANNPPSLGKLLASGKLREGTLFTHHANFFFRGLTKISSQLRRGKMPAPLATGYAKLDDWRPGCRLTFDFSHEHLTSSSAWAQLSGQARLLLFGLITRITDIKVEAVPYVIAHPVSMDTAWTQQGQYWSNHLELHVDSIDSFSRVRDFSRRLSERDLDLLRAVPENQVKAAFANILNEPIIPKDWGGERSDLLSDRVAIRGERMTTAFLFKGPAQFKPMTLSELGKNGDQIDRLFSEPADLFVLQHCHKITSAVRSTMRAYAQQVGQPRLFCIVDGFDTIRVLSAYNQCGLGATIDGRSHKIGSNEGG